MTVSLSLGGAILLATPPAWLALGGAALLLAYHLLDKVDGDVARYRGTFSIVGVYMDESGARAGLQRPVLRPQAPPRMGRSDHCRRHPAAGGGRAWARCA